MFWLYVYEPNEVSDFQLLDYSARDREVERSRWDYIHCGLYPADRMLVVQADTSAAARQKAIQQLLRYRFLSG